MMCLRSLDGLIVATCLFLLSCLVPSLPNTAATTSSIYSPSQLAPPIVAIGCMTGASDARMDSSTVKRLSLLYCSELLAHPLKLPGDNFTAIEYPTDLTSQFSGPNYTALEEEGYVAVFDLTLGSSYVDQNGTIHEQGQPSQCASDDCLRIFDAIINRCKWNSHYFGGYNQHISDCGIYSVYTLNCTDNLVNLDCFHWHSRWQPSYTTTPTSTTYSARHYTNTDFYVFTWTDHTTTLTSEVMVSTVTGAQWTIITPMMYTMDNTYTGYAPNPDYVGPTFRPRFSVVTSTSDSALELTTSETVIALPMST